MVLLLGQSMFETVHAGDFFFYFFCTFRYHVVPCQKCCHLKNDLFIFILCPLVFHLYICLSESVQLSGTRITGSCEQSCGC